MLWIITALLAAILITLLGAWRIVPGVLSAILGFVFWILLASMAWSAWGVPALVAVLALPLAALAVVVLVDELRNRPKRSAPLKPPPKHTPDWERNEGTARRAELDRLRKAIEDRHD